MSRGAVRPDVRQVKQGRCVDHVASHRASVAGSVRNFFQRRQEPAGHRFLRSRSAPTWPQSGTAAPSDGEKVWQTVRANEGHARKGNGAEGEVELPGASSGKTERPRRGPGGDY